ETPEARFKHVKRAVARGDWNRERCSAKRFHRRTENADVLHLSAAERSRTKRPCRSNEYRAIEPGRVSARYHLVGGQGPDRRRYRHDGPHRRASSRTATLQYALVRLVRHTRTPARVDWHLRGDELLRSAKNTGDRYSHRARSAARRRVANDDQAGAQTCGSRYDSRIGGGISSNTSATNFAVWHQSDRSSHFLRHLTGAARSRNPRQLHPGAARDEGRPPRRSTG